MKIEKTCKVHGVLAAEDIRVEKSSKYKAGFTLRCKPCAAASKLSRAGRCSTHGVLSPEDVKSNGRCAICHRASANRKRNLNREWFNAKIAEDKKNNPEKWKAIYKRHYQNSLQNHGAEERNTREIIRMHNLTREQYENMVITHDGKCAICNNPETRKARGGGITRLAVDHCHDTGAVRGLLCHDCNTGLGKFKDDIELMHLAIIYLEKHRKIQ